MQKTGVRIAKGILYVFGCIAAVILVVMLIRVGYETGLNSANVNMIIKDAFAKRAQAVLMPQSYYTDREMLEKLFTPRALAADDVLKSNYYSAFEVTDYYQNTDAEMKIVWPWLDEVTVKVTESVRDIAGTLIEQDESQQDEEAPKPIGWVNGVYEVTLRKDKLTGNWRINSMELLGAIVFEEDDIDSEPVENLDAAG